ncbi:MAG: hypothetical protein RL417_2539 [Pseudomonadota bacterium]
MVEPLEGASEAETAKHEADHSDKVLFDNIQRPIQVANDLVDAAS